MTSLINPVSIDATYPIAGQDNDTQGFRTNYVAIKTNFTQAAIEITNLQANVYANANVSAYLTTTTNGNISIGNLTINNVIQLANLSQTQISTINPSNGMMVYNNTYGNIQAYTSHLGRWGNITLS
jgi:hypothetical protein